MERHTPEYKRKKRNRQKIKRRLKSVGQESDVSSIDLDHISNDQFIDALDRAADRCKDYWTGCQGYLESYKDAIVCSENNDVDRGGHKGMNGLPRVAMSEYFSSIHEREQNSQQMCKLLRNRVDKVESLLEDAKLEREKLKGEHCKEKEQIRYFWRNKIFEEGSRGGRMIMAAVQKN